MFWRKKPETQRVRMEDLDQLRDAIDQLTGRVHELEEGELMRKLGIEDWYEKFRTLYARLGKRIERDEAAAPSAPREVNPAALKILGGMR